MQKNFPSLLNLLAWATHELSCAKHITQPHLEAEYLLSHILSSDRSEIYINPERRLTAKQQKDFFEKIKKRKQGIPLQYLTHEVLFYDCILYVDKRVLIPRPETELLCEKTVEFIKDKTLKILDIGVGSGAIAIALAKHCSNVKVLGIERSAKAIDVAKKNIKKNGVQKKVMIKKGNLFSVLKNKKFDLIISNPPYIKTADLKKLPLDVQKEPRNALNGGPDGILFYRKILKKAKNYLKDKGIVIFEIGEDQAKMIIKEALKNGFSLLKLEKDYAGKDRFLFFQ